MTKRERLAATLARAAVDRPAVAFWRHVPELDHDPRRLAEAMLVFQRRWDLDLVKMMPSGVYCVEDWGCRVAYTGAPSGAKQCTAHAVQEPADWARVRALDPGAGALGRELEAVRLVAAGRADDAPILQTVFSPLTIARKLAGDRLRADLADHPARVEAALEAITETMARYAAATLAAGADGLFVATQTAYPDTATAAEHARFDTPFLRRVLEAVAGRSTLTLLHAHGAGVYFDAVAALPVHAVNWHDRVTAPSLAEGARRFGGAVVGGLAEWTTLRRGPAGAVTAEAREAAAQTGGRGLVVAPGCVLPLDVPDAHLDAVVTAVR
jgi:uroporphyrinogen decarboxylase